MAELSTEQKYQSQIATEKGLLGIGKELALREQKTEKIVELSSSISDILESLPNNAINKTLSNKVEEFIEIVMEHIDELTDEVGKYRNDYEECVEEKNETLVAVEDLTKKMEEVETRWKERVVKLRNMCISKNKIIQNREWLIELLGYFFIGIFLVLKVELYMS